MRNFVILPAVMPSKKQTTIVLPEKLQPLKNELASIYGLKNVISAGLLLFSDLSDSKQKAAIRRVRQAEDNPTKKKTTKK